MNYLSKKDLQEKLQLSKMQVDALFLVPGFPFVRIGKQKRIREDRLDKWLEEHTGEEIKLDYSKV